MALSKVANTSRFLERNQRYRTVLSNSGVQGLLEELKKNADKWKSTKISVAVTGKSGTGKSTFINTLLGLKGKDTAQTDIVECTNEIKQYLSPQNQNFIVFDLPGVGTPKFPQKTYVHDVRLDCYDFFVIMAKCRFTENDTWLAREIKNLGKRFYFVRSHIQDDIDNHKRSHPKKHDPNTVIQKIRSDCKTKLGTDIKTEVFLIDSLETDKYDFGQLMEAFIKETSGIKAQLLAECLAPLTQEILDLKYQTLQEKIVCVPVKFVDVKRKIECDQIARNTINDEMAYYVKIFGINEERLKEDRELFKLSEIESDLTTVDLEELCSKLMETAEGTMLFYNLEMQELMKEFEVKFELEKFEQASFTMKILFYILHRLYQFASKLYKKVPTQFAKKCCEPENDKQV